MDQIEAIRKSIEGLPAEDIRELLLLIVRKYAEIIYIRLGNSPIADMTGLIFPLPEKNNSPQEKEAAYDASWVCIHAYMRTWKRELLFGKALAETAENIEAVILQESYFHFKEIPPDYNVENRTLETILSQTELYPLKGMIYAAMDVYTDVVGEETVAKELSMSLRKVYMKEATPFASTLYAEMEFRQWNSTSILKECLRKKTM